MPDMCLREDCKKKFKKGAGIHCPDFSRDLNVKNKELEEELEKESKPEKKKKGLFPL